MALHDSGRISRQTLAGLQPVCRHCGEFFQALELVRPVVAAGPLRLYACPGCRKLSFREDAAEAAGTERPARRISSARHVRSLVDDWMERVA